MCPPEMSRQGVKVSALLRRPNRFLLSKRYVKVRCIDISDLEVQRQSAIQPDDGDP